jgi:hypothetical protein
LGYDAAATSTLLAKFVPQLASELLAGDGELQASSWEAGSRVSGYWQEHELALELTTVVKGAMVVAAAAVLSGGLYAQQSLHVMQCVLWGF